MKIAADIKYAPKFESSQLTLFEACNLVDALTAQLLAENKYITRLETVLEHCQDYFDPRKPRPWPDNSESQLLGEIKDVLK